MTRHVILAYGRQTEYLRATFAVLSFWAWHSDDTSRAKTLIYADQPEFFVDYLAGLPVEYVLLTTDRLAQMAGPQRFVHRVKIAIIDQTFRDYPGDDVLYCDSDTFFVD